MTRICVCDKWERFEYIMNQMEFKIEYRIDPSRYVVAKRDNDEIIIDNLEGIEAGRDAVIERYHFLA